MCFREPFFLLKGSFYWTVLSSHISYKCYAKYSLKELIQCLAITNYQLVGATMLHVMVPYFLSIPGCFLETTIGAGVSVHFRVVSDVQAQINKHVSTS